MVYIYSILGILAYTGLILFVARFIGFNGLNELNEKDEN